MQFPVWTDPTITLLSLVRSVSSCQTDRNTSQQTVVCKCNSVISNLEHSSGTYTNHTHKFKQVSYSAFFCLLLGFQESQGRLKIFMLCTDLHRIASRKGAVDAMHNVGHPVTVRISRQIDEDLGLSADIVQTGSTMCNPSFML